MGCKESHFSITWKIINLVFAIFTLVLQISGVATPQWLTAKNCTELDNIPLCCNASNPDSYEEDCGGSLFLSSALSLSGCHQFHVKYGHEHGWSFNLCNAAGYLACTEAIVFLVHYPFRCWIHQSIKQREKQAIKCCGVDITKFCGGPTKCCCIDITESCGGHL